MDPLPYFFGYKTELFSFQNNPKDLDPSYKTDPLPYFFGYKTELFSFQNNPKDLDLSYKTDLDL